MAYNTFHTKWLLCLLTLYTLALSAHGQGKGYTAVENAEQIPWAQFSPIEKRFVVVGEAHHVSVIYPFQLSHLRYLVTKGFRHLVWEVPFSFSYIAQQYISTGSVSLLRYLSWSEEDRAYWIGVHRLNQTLPPGDKLHLWGIDHELGDNVGGMHRAKDFRKAVALMMAGWGAAPALLQEAVLSLQSDTTINALTLTKKNLAALQNHPEVAAFLGDRLPYFKALVNRLDHYKVARNDEMLEAFKELYSLFSLDTRARFLGRFGWGHTDKSYRKSMSWLLENNPSSPVKGSTFVIGVQYLNCTSAARAGGLLIQNDGIVSDRGQKRELAAINGQDQAPIKIFTRPSDPSSKGWAKAADVLFVFSGFPAITLLKR